MTQDPVGAPRILEAEDPVMGADALVERLLHDPDPLPHLAHATEWPEPFAARVVERLKQEADRHWYIDPNISLKLSDRIIAIGRRRRDLGQAALGMMARGDALKFIGRTTEAWETLAQAGQIFQDAGDDVGWARTRIGRLYLSTKLNRVTDALADAEQARTIFTTHAEHEKLLRLDFQTALVYNFLGHQRQALPMFRAAVNAAETLGEAGEQYLGPLYTNLGFAYEWLGDFYQALTHYERARDRFRARNEFTNLATVEVNIAYIAKAQGHYRRALELLLDVVERMPEQLPVESLLAKRGIIECYLGLNRYAEARDLTREIMTDQRTSGDIYECGRLWLHLAHAEAQLANYSGAKQALAEAEPIFTSLGATPWVAITHLWRGRIALREGDVPAALQAALSSADCFRLSGRQIDYASAVLLQGQAWFALGERNKTDAAGHDTLTIAQRYNVPTLRYAAHLLLGQNAEARQQLQRAIRRYHAAAATLDRVQRGLTITLRPGFLEDKGEGLRALIGLYLRTGQPANAFEALERAKSQTLLNYLTNREQMHWAEDDETSHHLIQELNRLRDEHHWFYRLAHETPIAQPGHTAVSPTEARAEVARRERQMRAITERLYLRGGHNRSGPMAPAVSLSHVQDGLDDATVLVEFYNDGHDLWAFQITRQHINVNRLPLALADLQHLLNQLHTNLAVALQYSQDSSAVPRLRPAVQKILQRLYAGLIHPWDRPAQGWQRLVIVPYGSLHFLPFHLLHNEAAYLIEQNELVILPAAGLVARPAPTCPPGALVLSHSWEGRLPYTATEAQMVERLFGGTWCDGQAATRKVLSASPKQILHIAAHGQHRLDQPDLSYIQLADGQLYTDDLLQHHLDYELVTLSACETGRANVAPGDELIGLGRGFLYAGAGALLVSLWPVTDETTLQLMGHFYSELSEGASKAAALRIAQRRLLGAASQPHPAFWGAFQLIGNANPLSNR